MMYSKSKFSCIIEENLQKIREIIQIKCNEFINFDFDSRYYREHIITDLFELRKLVKEDSNILDFGCGRGTLSALISSTMSCNVFGIDKNILEKEGELSSVLPSKLQNKVWNYLEKDYNVKYLFYDGISMPFSNVSFSLVFTHAVIEHIPPDNLSIVINEIKRVLKKDGYLYITQTPRKQSLKEKIGKILNLEGHDTLIDEHEIVTLLESNNFEIIEVIQTDLIPNLYVLPKQIRYIWDAFYPILSRLELLVLKTPLKYFATNIKIIAKKR